ncbi:MAG: hypothetical protein JWQ79_2380 [Mucilaginibacter sp.]|jgi:hypothetical protein|nr:hypothetical protein [Mucilaginibacter sp.]
MSLILFFSYLLLLFGILAIESTLAIADPDETFDKTHGLYHISSLV